MTQIFHYKFFFFVIQLTYFNIFNKGINYSNPLNAIEIIELLIFFS